MQLTDTEEKSKQQLEWEENLGSLGHTYLYLQEVGKINTMCKNRATAAKAAHKRTATDSPLY